MKGKKLNGNGSLAGIRERFEKRFSEIDGQFTDINAKFDEINIKFDEINGKFTQINKRLTGMEKSMKGLHKEARHLLEYVEFIDQDLQDYKKKTDTRLAL